MRFWTFFQWAAPIPHRRSVVDALKALQPYPPPIPCEVRHPIKAVSLEAWMRKYERKAS